MMYKREYNYKHIGIRRIVIQNLKIRIRSDNNFRIPDNNALIVRLLLMAQKHACKTSVFSLKSMLFFCAIVAIYVGV